MPCLLSLIKSRETSVFTRNKLSLSWFTIFTKAGTRGWSISLKAKTNLNLRLLISIRSAMFSFMRRIKLSNWCQLTCPKILQNTWFRRIRCLSTSTPHPDYKKLSKWWEIESIETFISTINFLRADLFLLRMKNCKCCSSWCLSTTKCVKIKRSFRPTMNI